jgi:hypothetical protein
MTTVNIQRDGSIFPPLQQDNLIVQILNGNIKLGKYQKEFYLNEHETYIIEPDNVIELKNELLKLINSEMPELFSKHYVVHFICPPRIAAKVKWELE